MPHKDRYLKRYTTFLGMKAEILGMSRKGDGTHRVLKVEHRGEPVVVKCYGLKGNRAHALLRQFGSRLVLGKSTYTARGRMLTERRTLGLWRREGFDVPRLLDLPLVAQAGQPCLGMEWIPGVTMAKVLRSPDVPLARKQELVARFTETAARRHARAIELRNPRLIFKHPTFSHVMVSDGRLVHFDFEVAFTYKAELDRYLDHEIAGFLRTLPRGNSALLLSLFTVFADVYTDRDRFLRVLGDLQRFGTVPLAGWLEPLGWCFMRFKRYRKIARFAGMIAPTFHDGPPMMVANGLSP